MAATAGLVGLAACGIGLAACGASPQATRSAPPVTSVASAVTTTPPPPPAKPRPKPRPKPKPRPAPGTLPQTSQLPSAATATFRTEMQALWAGVTHNQVGRAMPAFFPRAAYLQVKAIGNPGADWTDRLVGDFRLDLGAAHALLAGHPAELVAVHVPQGYAHWVPPDVCYNRVGYYEVPNARVVYRQAGQLRSFGIASMISWRGVWYVVHLGTVVRPGEGGVVDDPTLGQGSSAPSSTC